MGGTPFKTFCRIPAGEEDEVPYEAQSSPKLASRIKYLEDVMTFP